MSAVLVEEAVPAAKPRAAAAVALLGTGVVGGAFLKLLNTPAAGPLRLVAAANSRRQETVPARLAARNLREQLRDSGAPRDDDALLAALDASGAAARLIVDATASAALAGRHAEWLARGYHVVTANKALAG
ncbi:MAG TPA: homoserine dehydrogenase, partial [Rhodanobacter sp.]|nr:homoserine dehydrogenase [Rhodanobacter sp.]